MIKTSRPLLPHLTGLRALAAYLVLLCHGLDTAFAEGGVSYIQRFTACFAYLGMSVFFVLSGFVIAYTYHDRFKYEGWGRAAYHFAVARFARLYPLYLVVMVLIEGRSARYLYRKAEALVQMSFITLTQSWWNVQSVVFPPAWSISTEVFFYVAFAGMMYYAAKRNNEFSATRIKWLSLAIYAVFLAILYMGFSYKAELMPLLNARVAHPSNPDVWKWLQYFSPYVRIGEFFMGMCAAYAYMRPSVGEEAGEAKTRHALLMFFSACGIIGVMICHMLYYQQDVFVYDLSMNFGYAPFIAYILYATSLYRGVIQRLFSHRIAIIAGDMSYSVYLLQGFILRKLAYWFPDGAASAIGMANIALSLVKLLLIFALVSVVSWLSYRAIEVPSRRFIRGKLGG